MNNKIDIYDNNEVLIETNNSCTYTIVIHHKDIKINYHLENGEYNILVFNDANDDVTINESGYIKNGSLNLFFLELNSYNLKQNTNIDVFDNSLLKINTTYLGSCNKDITYNLSNVGSDSVVEIANNIVCLDNSDFSLNNIGNILKGSKHAKCHQKTRCLTMGNPKKARVLPILNIDENDVEASHSLSSGTIDNEVLFYMNSRGLNNKEALQLILISYLMPNDTYYDGFIDGNVIKDNAEKKVNQLCLM